MTRTEMTMTRRNVNGKKKTSMNPGPFWNSTI
jgi:hypothetical protein